MNRCRFEFDQNDDLRLLVQLTAILASSAVVETDATGCLTPNDCVKDTDSIIPYEYGT